MQGDVVSVERTIPAPAGALFALVADASRHRDFDGSGTVQGVRPGAPEQLRLGSTFGMSMRLGVPYRMVSTVVEFEPDRRIAWQTRPGGPLGRLLAGRIWRYEFEPVEGGTLVRESWDISQDKQRALLRNDRLAAVTAANMTKTLERLEALATAGS